MPQLAMWATRHPVELTARYSFDPTDPSGAGSLAVIVKDQGGRVMSQGSIRCDDEALDEFVVHLFESAWLCYLYGNPEEIQQSLSKALKAWNAGPRGPEITGS